MAEPSTNNAINEAIDSIGRITAEAAMFRDPMQQRQLDQIEPADMPYFEKVFAMHAQAQNFQAQASQYETEAARLRSEATALLGAHNSYVAHLFEKYGLTPGTDQIDQAGRIVRKDLP